MKQRKHKDHWFDKSPNKKISMVIANCDKQYADFVVFVQIYQTKNHKRHSFNLLCVKFHFIMKTRVRNDNFSDI